MGDLLVNHMNDLIVKSDGASVTGQSYETLRIREDRSVAIGSAGTFHCCRHPEARALACPRTCTSINIQRLACGLTIGITIY